MRRPFNEISPAHLIRICVPVVLKNLLPCSLMYSDNMNADFFALESNKYVALYGAEGKSKLSLRFKIDDYETKVPVVIDPNAGSLENVHCSLFLWQ